MSKSSINNSNTIHTRNVSNNTTKINKKSKTLSLKRNTTTTTTTRNPYVNKHSNQISSSTTRINERGIIDEFHNFNPLENISTSNSNINNSNFKLNNENTITIQNSDSNEIYTIDKENPTIKSRLKNEIFPKSVNIIVINGSIHYYCDLCKNICKNYKELIKNCNNSLLENRCRETELCSLFRDFIQLFKINYYSFESTEYCKYVKNKISIN